MALIERQLSYFSTFLNHFLIAFIFKGCFTENTGRNGGKNLGDLTTISEYTCQTKCQETDKCEYFVYKTSQSQCILTSKSASPVANKVGFTFGPKYC